MINITRKYSMTLRDFVALQSPVECAKYNGKFLIDYKIEPVSKNVVAHSAIIQDLETQKSYSYGMYLPKDPKNFEQTVNQHKDSICIFTPTKEKVHFHGRKAQSLQNQNTETKEADQNPNKE